MSAFMCDPNTHQAVAIWAVRQYGGQVDRKAATEAANVLAEENQRSVNYRYPMDTDTFYPLDPICPYAIMKLANLNPVQVLKHCDCLEYQSCETPDFDKTDAKRLIDVARSHATRALPGYEEAEWA